MTAEEVADTSSERNEVREAALKKVEELVLSGRDFSYADFSGARLPKVDFVGANKEPSDLSYANLQSTMLTKARMNGTELQGANLSEANLQGAVLWKAKLQGAYLSEAKLQGEFLREVELQGANLHWAELQGTNLISAKLQGAELLYSDLAYSDISGAHFNPLTDQELKSLIDKMSKSIDDAELRNDVKITLGKRTQKPTTLAQAAGEHTWAEYLGETVHTILDDPKNELKAAEDEAEYLNKLSTYLIEQSCQDQWVATGIINHRIGYSPFYKNLSQCLLSLKDQKNQSDRLVCPALSEINEDTVTSLKEKAAGRDPDNPTQPAFICQTEFSDPPSDSTNP